MALPLGTVALGHPSCLCQNQRQGELCHKLRWKRLEQRVFSGARALNASGHVKQCACCSMLHSVRLAAGRRLTSSASVSPCHDRSGTADNVQADNQHLRHHPAVCMLTCATKQLRVLKAISTCAVAACCAICSTLELNTGRVAQWVASGTAKVCTGWDICTLI